MSEHSTNLGLTFLAGGQAQKHVSVNESLIRLDAIVQLSVISAVTAAEPSALNDGDVYILPSGKTGTHWGAMSNHALAYWRDGAWEEITPRAKAGALMCATSVRSLCSPVRLGLRPCRCSTAISSSAAWCSSTGTAARWCMSVPATMAPYHSGDKALTVSAWGGAAEFGLTRHDNAAWFFRQGVSGATTSLIVAEGFSKTERARFPAGGGFVGAGAVTPAADNAHNLGSASERWGTVYAATGSINTSDARKKTPLAPIPESVKRAMRRIIAGVGVFQWRASVEAKGEDGARLHVGVMAQAVAEAFAAEGEDPERWALFCADELDDAGGVRFGLRPDQALWLAVWVLAEERGAAP